MKLPGWKNLESNLTEPWCIIFISKILEMCINKTVIDDDEVT